MSQTVIKLPPSQLKGKVSLEEAIVRRRSVRRYRREPLDLCQLSQILWSAQGITASRGLRATPSAGATYPLDIFVVIGRQGVVVSGSKQTAQELQAGIYHYEVDSHSLILHKAADLRPDLARASLDQEFIIDAPVAVVICAIYHRTSQRYGRRGERYVHMEVGHAGENIHLQAVALGLATVEIGAFHDEEVMKVLGLEEQIKPLYIMPVGKSA
ncbi:MAG: SagB/ThcOx family dehydrogenase [Dehalococcoidia bacterium]|nr:SagB/ThcOx family dehydrogenase [Dehalococcoidia bacterium]MDH4367020.1 SagB/ThcOx family dehydrogenase [Dehalococcoidia bacterium]